MSAQLTERWEQVKRLYAAAREKPLPARAEFLVGACAGDAALLSEVEALLAAQEKG